MSPPLSGVIRFEFDNDSSLNDENGDGRYSPMVEVGGMPWEANVFVSEDETFCIALYNMSNEKTEWSVDVDAEFILINSDTAKNLAQKASGTVCNDDYSIEDGFSLGLSEVIDEEKGFIKDIKITVEVHFTISNLTGIRFPPSIDFTDPNEPSHDVTLLIGGEKIYVNKGILAIHSPVFKAMFYGNFDEKNKKEIELKNVDREEFLEMLRLIYPFCKKITVDKVEPLLKLGDQFELAYVNQRLVNYLIDTEYQSSPVTPMEMLRLADKYRLDVLLKESLSKLWRKEHFKDIKDSSFYADLSAETKFALFERVIEKMK